jgi:hypothetical protein
VVVVGMNATFREQGLEDLKKVMNSGVITIACDIALPILSELGTPPTFVCSVDSHPVVANFYRRSQNILRAGVTALLSTTIHRDVVDECLKAGVNVRWIQGFSEEQMDFYRPTVIPVSSGGNVATTCYVIAAGHFRCKPVGLLGIECAWSDETPYYTLDDFKSVMRMAGINPNKAIRRFRKVYNRQNQKTYVADSTYWYYRQLFRELWKLLPIQIRRNTYNLTREGILSAKGLRQVSVKEFLDINA